jgi:hypothetical protein
MALPQPKPIVAQVFTEVQPEGVTPKEERAINKIVPNPYPLLYSTS